MHVCIDAATIGVARLDAATSPCTVAMQKSAASKWKEACTDGAAAQNSSTALVQEARNCFPSHFKQPINASVSTVDRKFSNSM